VHARAPFDRAVLSKENGTFARIGRGRTHATRATGETFIATNPKGFEHEGEAFFRWLGEKGFLEKNFYIVCGDRHWQYHSIRPDGFEDFSCGTLVASNSRLGRKPGGPDSTDPEGGIEQPYTQAKASGGFLHPTDEFAFYDENGVMLYATTKTAK